MSEKPAVLLSGVEERVSVADLRAIPIALPVRRSWRWRGLGQELGRWVLVRAESEEGAVGWGEATPLADWGGDYGRYYGETPTTVMHVVSDLIRPALLGVDLWDHAEIDRRMTGAIRGHPYARAAVDIAIWDLRGRVTNQPIHQLLGGSVRSSVLIAHMIGLMSSDEAVEEAKAAAADGVSAFQIKLTGSLPADVDKVAALRNTLGAHALLRADVNQGYGGLSLKDAIDAVRAIAEAGADVVEQPVEGVSAMAAVRAAVEVPIMADESCWTASDAAELVEAGAADAISVYVAKAGGLLAAQRVAELAHASGLTCDVNGSLESGIGTLASLHLAATCTAVSMPSVVPCPAPSGLADRQRAGRYYEDDVLTTPLRLENGRIVIPDAPGLGVNVDEHKVQELAKGTVG